MKLVRPAAGHGGLSADDGARRRMIGARADKGCWVTTQEWLREDGRVLRVEPHAFSCQDQADQIHLRLIQTTDLHVHVHPYDYYLDRPCDTHGLARTATHIDMARAEASNSLLFDSGDFLQGTPLGDFAASAAGQGPGTAHPMIAAMNTLGYDAATLGNHEFNYGLDFLMEAIDRAGFPIVSANVLKAGTSAARGTTLLPPSLLLDRTLTDGAGQPHRLRIGIVGFVTPQITTWDHEHLHGRVTSLDIIAAARYHVPRLRAAGADLVIALSHSGIGAPTPADGMENAATALAGLGGIDAILAGHSHLVFPSSHFRGHPGVDPTNGTLQGVPATMAGFWGSHLGLVDLLLHRDGGRWTVRAHDTDARPIARRNRDLTVTPLVESHPKVLAAVEAAHAATRAHLSRSVAILDTPLRSYFALVANDAPVQLMTEAQTAYARACLAGRPEAELPLLSVAAPFKCGGRSGPDHYTDIPAGPLAVRHIADLYPFPNTLQILRITGAEVLDWLERAASFFNQLTPSETEQPLLNPDVPSFNFDVVDGLTYEIDPTQPARFDPRGGRTAPGAQRVRDVRYRGQPIAPGATFLVVTNSYRAQGGGDVPGTGSAAVIHAAPVPLRDVLMQHIARSGRLAPRPRDIWRFAAQPGTAAQFVTGAAGAAQAPEVTDRHITHVTTGTDGFSTYTLAF